jgi:hypothetical protein
MAMTAEQKAAKSAQMKEYWAARRAEKTNGHSAPPESVRPPKQIAKTGKPVISNAPVYLDDVEHIDWETISIEDGNFLLGKFRDAYEKAGTVIQRRIYEKSQLEMVCFVCKKRMDRWIYRDDAYQNPDSGLKETALICSMPCYSRYGIVREELRKSLQEKAAGRK